MREPRVISAQRKCEGAHCCLPVFSSCLLLPSSFLPHHCREKKYISNKPEMLEKPHSFSFEGVTFNNSFQPFFNFLQCSAEQEPNQLQNFSQTPPRANTEDKLKEKIKRSLLKQKIKKNLQLGLILPPLNLCQRGKPVGRGII